MKEIKCDKKYRKQTFLKVLGIWVLVLFVLVGIAGAVPFAYVVDGHFSDNSGEGRISVIDTATNKVIAKVPGYFYGPGIAVNPAGTKVYVIKSSNNVSVVDTNTNTVTATIPVQHGANGVAVNPEGTIAYVTSDNWTNSENTLSESTGAKLALIMGTKEHVTASKGIVSVIDTATNTVTATIPLGSGARGVIVNPNGKKVYVTTPSNNNVSVIDTATNKVTATVPVGSYPEGVAINSDGKKLYVANGGSDTVSVIDTATNTVTATIPVESGSYGVAVTPDGKKVYVTNSYDAVSVIDTAKNKVTATVKVYCYPEGIAVTPDGKKVYVPTHGEMLMGFQVYVIDTTTDKVTYEVNTGYRPRAFGQFIGPSVISLPKPVAAFSASPTYGKVPLKVTFTDKSTGTPTKWKWSFGDGTSSTAKNPICKYSKAGNYTVTLTATNLGGNDTVTETGYITVITKPVASFSASPMSGKAPLTVAFTDISTGIPDKWKWSFGDGTISREKNPKHQYLQEGNYKITLTVSNTAGSSTVTKTNYIKVTTNTRPGILRKQINP